MECDLYHYSKPLNGTSMENFGFLSKQCLSNRLFFGTYLTFLLVLGIFSVISLLSLLYHLKRTSWKWEVQANLITCSFLIEFSSFLIILNYLLGLRGFLRAFMISGIMFFVIPGNVYLLVNWFLVQKAIVVNVEEERRKYWTYFLVFVGVYYLGFVPEVLVLGYYDITNMKINNLMFGVCHIWWGVCAEAIFISLYFVSKNLLALIENSKELVVDQHEKSKRDRAFFKVKRFSKVTMFLWGNGGMGTFGCGIWAIVSSFSDQGTLCYFYFGAYWLMPSVAALGLLLLYVALNFNKKEESSVDRTKSTLEQKKKSDVEMENQDPMDQFLERAD